MPGAEAVAGDTGRARDRESDRRNGDREHGEGRERGPAASYGKDSGSGQENEDGERDAASSGRTAERVQRGRSGRSAAVEVLARLGGVSVGEPEVGEQERHREQRDSKDRQRRS